MRRTLAGKSQSRIKNLEKLQDGSTGGEDKPKIRNLVKVMKKGFPPSSGQGKQKYRTDKQWESLNVGDEETKDPPARRSPCRDRII